MTLLNQIYKCNICGNIVEVVHTGGGQLVCCGQAMELMEEKNMDLGQEKHLPLIERTNQGIKVRVSSIPHPMEDEHYIEWIELMAEGKVLRKYLKPGDSPEANFEAKGDHFEAREYCNVHGLWKSQT